MALTTRKRGIPYARQHGLICEMIDGTDQRCRWRLEILNRRRIYLERILLVLEMNLAETAFRQPFHA